MRHPERWREDPTRIESADGGDVALESANCMIAAYRPCEDLTCGFGLAVAEGCQRVTSPSLSLGQVQSTYQPLCSRQSLLL